MFKPYECFLSEFDKKLEEYFRRDAAAIKCKKGCTFCCTNGDYPLSHLEMCYLMQGFVWLDKSRHDEVRENIRALANISNAAQKGYACPFLLDGECSVYRYRPLICRVHGLAYMRSDGIVELPECARCGLNYSDNFNGESVDFEPIKDDLSLKKIYKSARKIDFGPIKSLLDWFCR